MYKNYNILIMMQLMIYEIQPLLNIDKKLKFTPNFHNKKEFRSM